MLFATVAADNAGMIVILDIESVPCFSLQFFLPVGKRSFHLSQVKWCLNHIRFQTVCFHMGECDHFIEHLIRSFRDIAQGNIRRCHGALPNSEAVIVIQHIMLEFFQIFVCLRLVRVILDPICDGKPWIGIRQTGGLPDVGYNIFAKAVDAHLQPEAKNVLNLFPHLWVGHIQVGLFAGKEMQIIFIQVFVIFPRATLEHAGPVVRRIAFAAADTSMAPDIIVMIWICMGLFALLEPGVLVRGVVHNQIHKHLQPHPMCPVKNFPECIQSAVIRVNIHIIRNVISEVRIGRGIDRGEPDRVHTEALDVIQFLQHSIQIPDSIAVSVAKTARPDLIYGHFLVPM